MIDSIENGSMLPEQACKGLETDSYFEICRMSSGAIKSLNLYPNPANGVTSSKYLLTDTRKLKITIHDINGKFIKQFMDYSSRTIGEHSEQLDISGIERGFYLIAITSDRGEQVVQRLIIGE